LVGGLSDRRALFKKLNVGSESFNTFAKCNLTVRIFELMPSASKGNMTRMVKKKFYCCFVNYH
jgi:hypothetical protein